jgi:hypothetical protein
MPGVTNLPVASTTFTFAPALRFGPMAAILPLRINMSAFCSVPCDAVRIVALRINVSPPARRCSCACARTDKPHAGPSTPNASSKESNFLSFISISEKQ